MIIKKKWALVVKGEILESVVFVSTLACLMAQEGFKATRNVVSALQYTIISDGSNLTTSSYHILRLQLYFSAR